MFKLHAVQMRVSTVRSHQLGMIALFQNTFLTQHDDASGVADGGQAVCDDKCRAVAGQPFQRILNDLFTFVVQRAGRFVKNQNRRILQSDARNG